MCACTILVWFFLDKYWVWPTTLFQIVTFALGQFEFDTPDLTTIFPWEETSQHCPPLLPFVVSQFHFVMPEAPPPPPFSLLLSSPSLGRASADS